MWENLILLTYITQPLNHFVIDPLKPLGSVFWLLEHRGALVVHWYTASTMDTLDHLEPGGGFQVRCQQGTALEWAPEPEKRKRSRTRGQTRSDGLTLKCWQELDEIKGHKAHAELDFLLLD